MDRNAVLPPLGLIGENDHSLVTLHLSNLVKEAMAESADFITRAERNLEVYQLGASPQPNRSDIVSNAVQDAVNATVDFATKEPPIRKLNPVERGEPGKVFYYDTPDANAPIQGPFTEEQAAQMAQAQQPVIGPDGGPVPQEVAGPDGQPTIVPAMQPIFKPDNFVTINDRSVADYFQKPMDVYWNRGRLDQGGRMTVHYGHVFGFLFPIYEWDKDYRRPRLWFDIPIRDIYVDPFRTCVEDMAYTGVDWWIDAEQAKAMFPRLSDIIEERADTGQPERPDGSSSTGAQTNSGGAYQRNTIILRVFWLRNQPCPYTTEEAIADGLLVRKVVPVQPIVNAEQEFPKGAMDDAGNTDGSDGGLGGPVDETASAEGILPGAQDEVSQGSSDDAVEGSQSGEAPSGLDQPASSGVGGTGADTGLDDRGVAVPPPQIQTREALYAGDTEVTPPTINQPDTLHPSWPMYRCTRQIITVLNLVVDDRECEYFDMPVLHMIATPIPYRPWGQGLPERLEAMQAARTQMLTAIADHAELHAHPIFNCPQSSWDRLPAEFKETGAKRAGMTVVSDDDMFKMLAGNVGAFVNPPPMAEALVKAEEIYHNELSERSGNPEVMRGETPPGVESGYAIQLLTQNASNRFGFSQQWTRDFYVRLSKFVMHDIANPQKVSAQDIREIDSRYPLALIREFQKHAAALEWNIDVDLQTGAGSARNKKQAMAVEANKIVSPITGFPALSDESLSDELGIDFQTEMRNNQRAAEMAMQRQVQQAAMMPQPEQKPGKQPSSNGNGQHASNGNGRM